MELESRTYTINGKELMQTALSPFQAMRLVQCIAKIQAVLKKAAVDIEWDENDLDITPMFEVIEFEKPQLLVDAFNIVLKDATTERPCYASDVRLTLDDLLKLDPRTAVGVVADFFSLNDVVSLSQMLSETLGKIQKMFSSNGLKDSIKKTVTLTGKS